MPVTSHFEALEQLKQRLTSIRVGHRATMTRYISKDVRGFVHQLSNPEEASRSSSSTCIGSLVAVGLWNDKFPLWEKTQQVADELMIEPWESARLDPNNPFTVSFIIEGVLDLREAHPNYGHAIDHHNIITKRMAPILVEEFNRSENNGNQKGAIKIAPYPESAFLTQLAFRVLQRLGLAKKIAPDVHRWSRQEINRQIALISAQSRIADPLQLAYALILAAMAAPDAETSPEDKHTFEHGLRLFFDSQNDDGSWPQSQPLFHYPAVGNAYCFEYELLTQLLGCKSLWDDLLPYMSKLKNAASPLEHLKFDLDRDKPGAVVAWASGHHPHLEGPESWSTASVYHFAYKLDRLLAEAIRREVFNELGAVYAPPVPTNSPTGGECPGFADGFLDADLKFNGETLSLRDTIAESFVYPIAKEAGDISKGRKFSDETPMSAILFGPPGTSKTQLATYISEYISWPLLPVDPSYLVQEGMDQIQAMANRLFSMLTVAEQIVVLLDEFDEMGRDRARSNEMLARFITTAMLPKLAKINDDRKIVFLLATNYVSGFDAAFSRGGRFDMLVQVMPPNRESKFEKWSVLETAFEKTPKTKRTKIGQIIDDLTYAEAEQLATRIDSASDQDSIFDAITKAGKNCTLSGPNQIDTLEEKADSPDDNATSPNKPGKKKDAKDMTWRNTCASEQGKIRIPGL